MADPVSPPADPSWDDKRPQALVVASSHALRAPIQDVLRPSFEVWGAGNPAEAREWLDDQAEDELPTVVLLRAATVKEGRHSLSALRSAQSAAPYPVLLVLEQVPEAAALADLPDNVDVTALGSPALHREACMLARLAAAELQVRQLQRQSQEYSTAVGRLQRAHEIDSRRFEDMARYLPPPVVEAVRQGAHLALGREVLTVVFCDLRGFTDAMEFGEAGEAVALLSDYLGECNGLVNAHGGTLDKFMGDGFLAYFGGVVHPEGTPLSAVRCALKIHDRLEALKQTWFERGLLPVGCGVALCTGPTTLTPLGGPERLDFTVLGTPVNLATRLPAFVRGGDVVMVSSTHELVKQSVEVKDPREVRVPGFADPVKVVTLVKLR